MTQPQARLHTFLVVRQVGKPDRIVVWDTQEITVGRAAENDVAVDQEDVSRKHAIFAREEGSYVIRNLSMSNGTQVNGEDVKAKKLAPKDLIRIGELQIQFIQSRKNPASHGLKVDYASQLKDFAAPGGGDAGATMLGLGDALPADEDADDEFKVGDARDFEYDLHGMDARSAPTPRDLDLDLEGLGIDEAPKPTQQAWTLEDPGAPQAEAPKGHVITLRVDLAGLKTEHLQALEALFGRVIELPPLKIRIRVD